MEGTHLVDLYPFFLYFLVVKVYKDLKTISLNFLLLVSTLIGCQ